jgi:PDZ domain-containing secreted protein
MRRSLVAIVQQALDLDTVAGISGDHVAGSGRGAADGIIGNGALRHRLREARDRHSK